MIKETNKSTGLEFYANVALHSFKYYTSYVRGKNVNYSPSKINVLLHIPTLSRCNIQNRMCVNMNERMCERMKEEFCQPGVKWVLVKGEPLRLHTRLMRPIRKA